MNKIRYNCKPGFQTVLSAIALLLGMASCNDYLPDASAPIIPSDEEVQVELSFGFADEDDGYTVSGKVADTRSRNTVQNGAFCAALAPAAQTRGEGDAPDLKPDALYNLYVLQYNADGTLLKQNSTSGSTTIGTKLSYTLSPSEDCQLVVIACGNGNSPSAAISGNLSNIQKLTMPNSIFESIPTSGATQDQMNKMPYILHLEHVKVTSDGKLQSVEGAHDARLLLKRLATKLTVNWNMDYTNLDTNYKLKEVKLCQVPADFRLLPASESTEWGTTYPSSVSEFKETYRLTTTADLNAGTKTVWIPANVRGTSIKATSPYYRTKENAPTAASYVELVVDNSVKQERLYYCAYLGGDEPTDFNLYENTDYNWTLNVTSANYRSDARIQLLDQTPVVSTNLVETSNCFMMQPGTNICFNPYKHEAGTGGWNTYLTNGSTLAADKTIATVRVLWQTKDAGTSGDLVMGYVIDDNKHENLVNVSDIGNKDKALVHVKVPVTKGGNAVIEAKNASGVTVWSWHIWVSDYVPVGLNGSLINDDASRREAIEAARTATIGGVVHAYGGYAWTNSNGAFYKKVMMDRNLGALRNSYSTTSTLDAARAFGMLYQWGRKDPIPGSLDGSNRETDMLYNGYGEALTLPKNGTANLDYTIKNPMEFCPKLTLDGNSWNLSDSKTIYDPCPYGWKVPDMTGDDKKNIFKDFAMGTNSKMLAGGKWYQNGVLPSEAYYAVSNGFLYSDEVWFPQFSLREFNSGILRDPWREGQGGKFVMPSFTMWGASANGGYGYYVEFSTSIGNLPTATVSNKAYGFGVRCVQK